jgi:nucleotide-binding universal stress UspA family protein
MKKILCPTNFSDTAANGVAYAAKLAKKISADVTLFNVRSLTDITPEEALMGEALNAQAVRTQLDKVCQEVTTVFKVSCYADVETSISSMSKIVGEKAKGFDLVVIGTNGADSLGQYFLGSDTYHIVQHLTVPAIAVPAGCVYSDIANIVYAFDVWRNNTLPITQLIKLSKILGSKLCVLQVMEESVSKEADAELKGLRQAIYQLYKSDVELSFETVHAAHITEGINDFMLRSKADILALCSEHRGFLGRLFHKSVIKSISGSAGYPVLVFHG